MEEKTVKKSNFKLTTVIVFTLMAALIALGCFVNSIGYSTDDLPEPNIAGARVICKIDFTKEYNGIERVPALTPDEVKESGSLFAPLSTVTITVNQVNSFIVVALLGLLCFWLTRDLKVKPESKRQILAEFIVEKVRNIVIGNMSEAFDYFVPFIASLLAISGLSSLSSLFGWFPPTADLNTILGWSLLVFGLITYQKLRSGLGEYLKGYTQPIFIMLPLNILGEIATPLSMTFRHFGNVCSGLAISALVTWALSGASQAIWSLMNVTGWLSEFAFLRVGIPAVLSIYFDIFSGCLQAFIFCMLTMINIYLAYLDSNDTIAAKKLKKAEKAAKKAIERAK